MKIVESLRIALRALVANKMRAILTMLGIIIGVGAVITLLSVGEGVQTYITKQFESIGTNIFFIMPGSFERELDKPAYLTLKDAAALTDTALAPDILRAVPLIQGSGDITVPGEETSTQVNGVTAGYPEIRDWYPADGTFFTEEENQARTRVAVLGKIVADKLFPDDPSPIGKIVRINGVPFRVVGIMEERGGSSFGSEDDVIIVPLNTAMSRLYPYRSSRGEPSISMMYVQAIGEERMEAAITEASEILRERHRIKPGETDDFSIISQSDLIGTFEQITGVLTVFLGVIAGISLLVGGIGIMNIMLVSVTERTREIGLRKAVGARKRDILWQFLIEAMLLSMIGGFIGIALGTMGATIITLFLKSEGFEAIITLGSITLATLFSAAVGLFFGIYPAQRAASLNPIDALRYE